MLVTIEGTMKALLLRALVSQDNQILKVFCVFLVHLISNLEIVSVLDPATPCLFNFNFVLCLFYFIVWNIFLALN